MELLSCAVERWEESVRSYERRHDGQGRRTEIPDEIKTGILQEMCPEVLRTHLYLNSSKFNDYRTIRNDIQNYMEVRQGQAAGGAMPMDI
eukprot:8988103-Heterocapsa_arctica.AAC.1